MATTIKRLDEDELDSPPIVGRYYLVYCAYSLAAPWSQVKDSRWTHGGWVPLLSDFHEDRDIIGFSEVHAHIDLRFLSRKDLHNLSIPRSFVFGVPVSAHHVTDFRWEKRRCNRQFPDYPTMISDTRRRPSIERPVTWLPLLERAYLKERVTCGKCPHRGIDLRTVDGDADGNKICPGHGLRWDNDGNLNPRVFESCETGDPSTPLSSSISWLLDL